MYNTFPHSVLAVSSDSNLVISSSAEHSNTSGNSEQDHLSHCQAKRYLSKSPSVTNHAYANADVSFIGEFRPFTPIYVNSDEESMRELMSERGSHHASRTREGRGWSVASSHGDKIHANQTREGRGWSDGPSQRLTVPNQYPREVRGWSVGASERDRVQRVNSREGRGWSAGVSDRDRIQIKQSREGKGWSAGISRAERTKKQQQIKDGKKLSAKNGNKIQHIPQPREGRGVPQRDPTRPEDMQDSRKQRAQSVSATAKYKVDQKPELPRPRSYTNNLSTVLSKPLPLPPFSVPPPTPLLKRVTSPGQIPPPMHSPPPPLDNSVQTRSIFGMESGDYTAPVPISERYKYDPKIRQNETEIHSVQGQPFFIMNQSHDYSDPDEPEDDTFLEVAERYDHLTPPDVEIHPEGHSQVLMELEGLKDDAVPTPPYEKGYVPTEVCINILPKLIYNNLFGLAKGLVYIAYVPTNVLICQFSGSYTDHMQDHLPIKNT